MIYLIRAVGTYRYKIGYAVKPQERLNGLQTGCPHRLELTAVIEGNIADERHIHKALKKYRLHGEWFELFSLYPLNQYFGFNLPVLDLTPVETAITISEGACRAITGTDALPTKQELMRWVAGIEE